MPLVFYFYTYLFSSWSLYRFLTNFSEAVDEFIFKPLIWMLPIIFIVVLKERKSITKSLGLEFSDTKQDLLYGALTAFGFYLTILIGIHITSGKIIFNPLH